MKRLMFSIIVLTLAGIVPVRASVYYSVNIDKKTIEAMTAAYLAAYGVEDMYHRDATDISKHFLGAEAAMATVWVTKYSDRRAMTNLSYWDSDENYYYKRIYKLVFNQILPKTIVVTQECMKDPSTALYWGSYIAKVCADTKSLCQQFETVVTNGRLSFKDIPFLELTADFKKIVDMAKIGSVDWNQQLKNLTERAKSSVSEEAMDNFYDQMIDYGVQLAAAGVNDLMGGFPSRFFGTETPSVSFTSVFNEVKNTVTGGAFDIIDSSVMDVVNSAAGRQLFEDGDFTRILTSGEYNIAGWISNYVKPHQNQYYTQKAKIVAVNSGSEILASYTPPMDIANVAYGSHWLRKETKVFLSPNLKFPSEPSTDEWQAAKVNSLQQAGFSQSDIDLLNNNNEGSHYEVTYTADHLLKYCYGYRLDYTFGWDAGVSFDKTHLLSVVHFGYAFAYSLQVTRSWNTSVVVYEDVFDSFKMDFSTFENRMNTLCEQYNKDAQDGDATSNPYYGMKFKVEYEQPVYYSIEDKEKLKDAVHCRLMLECHDVTDLLQGDIQYKCNDDCEDPGDSHMKICSMMTSNPGGTQTDEFAPKIAEVQQKIDKLTQQQSDIESRRNDLLRQMSSASGETLIALRNEWTALAEQSQQLQEEIDSLEEELQQLRHYQQLADEDRLSVDDNYQRIPYLEQKVQKLFKLTWTDEGKWSRSGNDYIYTRPCKLSAIDSRLEFTATVSMYDKAHFFLGVRYHRAKIRISWSLRGYGDSETIADEFDLDPETPEANAEKVNQRMSEIREEFPSCSVNPVYEYNNPERNDSTEDVYHLLWSSDRLEVARHVEIRLAAIYNDLVILERYLHYKHSIIDWLADLVPFVNDSYGRHNSIAEESRRRWMHFTGSQRFDDFKDERHKKEEQQ